MSLQDQRTCGFACSFFRQSLSWSRTGHSESYCSRKKPVSRHSHADSIKTPPINSNERGQSTDRGIDSIPGNPGILHTCHIHTLMAASSSTSLIHLSWKSILKIYQPISAPFFRPKMWWISAWSKHPMFPPTGKHPNLQVTRRRLWQSQGIVDPIPIYRLDRLLWRFSLQHRAAAWSLS